MAIFKKTAGADGVPVEYHRVVGVRITTNEGNLIEVCSYLNAGSRRQEKADQAARDAGGDVPNTRYTSTSWHQAPYDQAMTIESAYAYLKALPEFEGASDVPEGGGADGGGAE